MTTVQQDIMCILLKTLLDRELITRDLYDKSREAVLSRPDWPDFFVCPSDDRKEAGNGNP